MHGVVLLGMVMQNVRGWYLDHIKASLAPRPTLVETLGLACACQRFFFFLYAQACGIFIVPVSPDNLGLQRYVHHPRCLAAACADSVRQFYPPARKNIATRHLLLLSLAYTLERDSQMWPAVQRKDGEKSSTHASPLLQAKKFPRVRLD